MQSPWVRIGLSVWAGIGAGLVFMAAVAPKTKPYLETKRKRMSGRRGGRGGINVTVSSGSGRQDTNGELGQRFKALRRSNATNQSRDARFNSMMQQRTGMTSNAATALANALGDGTGASRGQSRGRGGSGFRGGRGARAALNGAGGNRGGFRGNSRGGRGNRGGNRGGRGGNRGGRGRGGKQGGPLKAEDLDKEMDEYLFQDESRLKDHLDQDLENYVKQRDSKKD